MAKARSERSGRAETFRVPAGNLARAWTSASAALPNGSTLTLKRLRGDPSG